MGMNEQEFESEKSYLDSVIEFLRGEIVSAREALHSKKQLLYRSRQEEGVLLNDAASPGHSSDLSQHLLEDQRQLQAFELLTRRLNQYESMLFSPYFGRFDFKEDGEGTSDKIYVGLHNLYDDEGNGDILVYDWRAPICSIFYRNEPGHASYTAPNGEIDGDVTLKRQYCIEHSKLKYYFDCSLTINDEILQEVLAHNASPQMQSIVRTIQSEQDLVIRDTQSDLLMAQGAAGSGKTTIALHRIAYLLYHSAVSGLTSKNIVILSLSDVFSTYISSVLPQLGEENVKELTFDILAEKLTGITPSKGRMDFNDSLIREEKADDAKPGISHLAYLFKGSRVFAEILERFLRYYEQNLIEFEDIYYGGEILAHGDELRRTFLGDKTGLPPLSRLRRIENILNSRIELAQPALHKRLEKKISAMEGHQFDFKTIARYQSIKEAQRVKAAISRFTQFDAVIIYHALFADKRRFYEICKGLELPDETGVIFDFSASRLDASSPLAAGIGYDDIAPLCYLSLLLDRHEGFEDVRHIVVDEAQDYLPMHYAVLGRLFKSASFTVLGDIGQSVETDATPRLFDDISELLNKRRPVLLKLNKSYRCSYEIMNFALKIPEARPDIIPFERREKEPELIHCTQDELDFLLAADITAALDEGFDTAAVICKTQTQARKLFDRLRTKRNIKLLESAGEVTRGAMILPAYLSKGLEFDCVFVPDVDDGNYGGPLSRRLLYIACTRALHRLRVYYSSEGKIIKRLKK